MPVKPEPIPLILAAGQSSSGFTDAASKGIVCPVCGCCNSLKLLKGWVCRAPGCGFWAAPHRKILSHLELEKDTLLMNQRHYINPDSYLGDVKVDTFYIGAYKIYKYDFYGLGYILHGVPTFEANAAPGGADELLRDYQHNSLHWVRHDMGHGKVNGGVLTKQFSFNTVSDQVCLFQVLTVSRVNHMSIMSSSGAFGLMRPILLSKKL